MSWLSNIDKKQLALHVFFICLVGVVSAFTSIVLCICVNTSYRLNQEYSWLVFLLPVLGIVTLAFYKAMKLSYFYSTDDMVMEMRENKPVSPTLAPAILVAPVFRPSAVVLSARNRARFRWAPRSARH